MGYYGSEPTAVDGESDVLEASTTIDDVDADSGE
jgi:hypothetical protein